uniref:C3H1-type domain-containing protein n=1 Tax=Chromera velia CCMP2878 TaxID=1169474 RepID=A0A0G4F7N7_9ALVE|eukprot:Cvel_15488.t1-p1 / transcript=Cvel_15488.t1 / gene=Cvel_15488 / organism=Chromera_velia_CCMP2878 / gene_product=hypothetical protein / transcript_product=hypothetical protein / location=Cvel_scaffold1149:15104-20099(-) / protein_length=495 / sequence_SO=supercontig / SO=protein_coding / is_pseudo=false
MALVVEADRDGPEDGKSRTLTLSCEVHRRRKCYKGARCPYSHDERVLVRKRMNLCPAVAKGNQCNGSKCQWSHEPQHHPCPYHHAFGVTAPPAGGFLYIYVCESERTVLQEAFKKYQEQVRQSQQQKEAFKNYQEQVWQSQQQKEIRKHVSEISEPWDRQGGKNWGEGQVKQGAETEAVALDHILESEPDARSRQVESRCIDLSVCTDEAQTRPYLASGREGAQLDQTLKGGGRETAGEAGEVRVKAGRYGGRKKGGYDASGATESNNGHTRETEEGSGNRSGGVTEGEQDMPETGRSLSEGILQAPSGQTEGDQASAPEANLLSGLQKSGGTWYLENPTTSKRITLGEVPAEVLQLAEKARSESKYGNPVGELPLLGRSPCFAFYALGTCNPTDSGCSLSHSPLTSVSQLKVFTQAHKLKLEEMLKKDQQAASSTERQRWWEPLLTQADEAVSKRGLAETLYFQFLKKMSEQQQVLTSLDPSQPPAAARPCFSD